MSEACCASSQCSRTKQSPHVIKSLANLSLFHFCAFSISPALAKVKYPASWSWWFSIFGTHTSTPNNGPFTFGQLEFSNLNSSPNASKLHEYTKDAGRVHVSQFIWSDYRRVCKLVTSLSDVAFFFFSPLPAPLSPILHAWVAALVCPLRHGGGDV